MMNRILNNITGISLMFASLLAYAGGTVKETVDVIGQGALGPVVSAGGAKIIRSSNGITARLKMPTPVTGSYMYPDGNAFQPEVYQGFPEVFSGWMFIFNEPEHCDGPCDGGDLSNPAARGGAYNFAGHVVGGPKLNFAGHVAVGATPFMGFPLDNPAGAEVHLAIAPHGELQPDYMPTQIKFPIGTPAHWWLALFIE